MAREKDASKSTAKKRRLEVSIEHLPSGEGSVAPYAAVFPAGLPNHAEGVTFQAYRNEAPFRKKHHLLVGRGEGVDYVGTNFPMKQGSRYAVGLFNKAEGSLKLTALAGDKVFRMEPRVPGLQYENDEDLASTAEEEPEKDQAALIAERKARKEMLVETFGSKRARIQQNARQREKVEEDAIAAPEALASMLASAVNAIPSQEDVNKSITSLESRLIPPCNLQATSPAGVYPVDLLIPPEAQAALNLDPYQKAAKHPDRPLKMYFGGEVSSFVRRRVHRLSVEGDPQGTENRVKCLAYLAHLVDFYRLPPQKVQRFSRGGEGHGADTLAREMGIPLLVLEILMERFMTKVEGPGGRAQYTRPQRAVDLTIANILVLALHVDQFCSDPGDIAAALQMTVAQLLPRYKELGCKVRKLTKAQMEAGSGSSGYEVTLSAPVVFPGIKRGPGRG